MSIFNSVVFPAPLGPITPTNSDENNVNDTPSNSRRPGTSNANCLASIVRATDQQLQELIADIDERLKIEKVGFRSARFADPPRIVYRAVECGISVRLRKDEFWVYPDPRVTSLRESIEDVVRGKRPSLTRRIGDLPS